MGGARICRQGGRTAYLWGEPDFTIHLAQKKKDQNSPSQQQVQKEEVVEPAEPEKRTTYSKMTKILFLQKKNFVQQLLLLFSEKENFRNISEAYK